MKASDNISPILNNPYEEPKWHYDVTFDGNLDYSRILAGRRPYAANLTVVPNATPNKALFSAEDISLDDENANFINGIRQVVKEWREQGYPKITRTTRDLLEFWFSNPERELSKSLFFCQREAVEMTEQLLTEQGVCGRARLIQDGHEHMDRYAQEESADVICFNFGYLPGGDHAIATRPETSIEAYYDIRTLSTPLALKVRSFIAANPDCTNEDISQGLRLRIQTVTPRVKELKESGIIAHNASNRKIVIDQTVTKHPLVGVITPLWRFSEWMRAIRNVTAERGGQSRFVTYASDTDPVITEMLSGNFDVILVELPTRQPLNGAPIRRF